MAVDTADRNSTDSDRMSRDCSCSWNCSLHADSLSWLDKRFLDTFDSKAATNAGTEIHTVDRMDMLVDCYEVADCSGCELDQSLNSQIDTESIDSCFHFDKRSLCC